MSRVSPVAAPTPTLVGNPIAPQPTAAPSLAPDSIGSGNTASPDKLAALAARANDPLGPDVHGTPYDAAINSAARANNLPPTLLASLIESESSFNPYSLSPTGAQGLTQLEPGTAGELGVKNAWDPTENINGGAQYLRKMLDQSNGDLTTALEKYNAGPYSKHLSGSFGYADGIEKRQAQFANAGGNVPVDLAQRLPTLHEGVGSADSQAVRAVQDRLGIPADGAFGPQTKAAVEKFQTERGLTADGVVGGATWKALGLGGASNASAPSQPSPAPGAPKPAPAKPPTTSGSAATTNHPTLDEGSRGAAVKQVQRAVGARVDGVFGPKTEAAIEKFQRAHGLDDDGIVGPKTWKAIDVAQHPKPVASKPTGPVASPTPAPTPNPTAGATPTPTPAKPGKTAPTPAGTGPTLDAAGPQLKSGAKGNDVAHLQKALGIPADGTFGPTTKAAVEAYQADHGLAVDGVLGPKTRASLAANPSSQVSGSPTNGHYSRLSVVQHLANTPGSTTDATQLTDLANPNTTTQRTVDMLGWMFEHGSPNITLTAVNSDHHNDGPNLHSGGAAIDFVPQNDGQASRVVSLLNANPYVTNVGLSGGYDTAANDKALSNPNIIGFHDGGTGPHIHVGTSPDAGNSIGTRGRF